jgi:trigger factor
MNKLNIDTQFLDDRQAKITVTVDPERLQLELQSAARRIAGKVNIPGFRKGKAPFPIVMRYFGEDAIFDEALEPLGQAVYAEAIEEAGLEPYAAGSLDDISRNPLVLSFTIPLMPEVELGKYRDIRVKYEAIEVKDSDVEDAIDRAREQQATHEHVDRPVALEDVALLDINGTFTDDGGKKQSKSKSASSDVPSTESDETFINRTSTKVLIAKKATYPVPGFPAEIIGMSAGDSKSFDIAISKSDKSIAEELRGRKIHFDVTCTEVFKREVPVLDDDFAKSLGTYESLDDLRTKVREELEHEAGHNSRAVYTDKVLHELLEKFVKLSYPPIIVDERIDEMVKDFDRQLHQQGLNLEDYLSLNKLSMDEVRNDFRDSAVNTVEKSLVLGRVSEVEQLDVSEEDIKDETQTRLLSFGAQASLATQLMNSAQMRRAITNQLLTDKTLDRLEQIARGNAPKLDESKAKAELIPGKPKAAKTSSKSKKAGSKPKKSNKAPTD